MNNALSILRFRTWDMQQTNRNTILLQNRLPTSLKSIFSRFTRKWSPDFMKSTNSRSILRFRIQKFDKMKRRASGSFLGVEGGGRKPYIKFKFRISRTARAKCTFNTKTKNSLSILRFRTWDLEQTTRRCDALQIGAPTCPESIFLTKYDQNWYARWRFFM